MLICWNDFVIFLYVLIVDLTWDHCHFATLSIFTNISCCSVLDFLPRENFQTLFSICQNSQNIPYNNQIYLARHRRTWCYIFCKTIYSHFALICAVYLISKFSFCHELIVKKKNTINEWIYYLKTKYARLIEKKSPTICRLSRESWNIFSY